MAAGQKKGARTARRMVQRTPRQERMVVYPIRLPESVLGRIMRLTTHVIATGDSPIGRVRTHAETIRALIYRGLEASSGHEVIDEMLPALKVFRQLDAIKSVRTEAIHTFQRAAGEIGELLGIGAKHEALAYYHTVMDGIEEMPPTVWRDWLVRQLQEKFPDLEQVSPSGIALQPQPARRTLRVASIRRAHQAGVE